VYTVQAPTLPLWLDTCRTISDEYGSNVAKWFYEELFTMEVIDADAVAYASDAAVGKLQKLRVSPHR
jgi:hypothetical protein